MTLGVPATWTNWVGNQSFTPQNLVYPATEEEVVAAVRHAAERGIGVRVAAAGHSFTPIVETDGLLLDLAALRGVVSVDAARRRTIALPGTLIRDFGQLLWDAGLALHNQGDIDTQQIAGAVSTATHGSRIDQPSFSASVRAVRLVTGAGEVLDVGADQPELLHGAQVAVGMLGVILRLELDVVPAYRLRERIEQRPYADVMERWDELVANHRHFSFFWLPCEESASLYGLETPPGETLADTCYLKLYDEAALDEPVDATPGRRVDRSYEIYPAEFKPNFHELEYFVPFELGPDAIRTMRELMLRSLPDSVYPMEVRTTAAEEAYLSPAYGTPTTVISVSGRPGADYWRYLRDVDATLARFGARVHWGKLHFLTRERLDNLYPEAEAFRRLRRELDPQRLFLNDHLRPLFA